MRTGNRKLGMVCGGLILFLLGRPGWAADRALELAEALMRQGATDAAITEYKRYLFFHPEAPDRADVCRRLGLAYRAQEEWELAISWQRRALHQAVDGQERTAIRIELAETLLLSGAPDAALLELLKAEASPADGGLRRRVLFWQAVTYLYQYRWQEAADLFEKELMDTPSAEFAPIVRALKRAAEHGEKSPTLARWLSTFVPGAGQIYAGDWRAGLNALALNGVLLYVTASAIGDRHFDDAAFWGLMLFQRYYSGNRYRAAKAAEETNERFHRHVLAEIKRRLQAQLPAPSGHHLKSASGIIAESP